MVGSALAFQSPSEAVQKIVDTINNLTHGAAHEVPLVAVLGLEVQRGRERRHLPEARRRRVQRGLVL